MMQILVFELFQELLYNIKFDVVRMLSRMEIENPEAMEAAERERRAAEQKRMQFQHADSSALDGEGEAAAPQAAEEPQVETFVREQPKVGRNEPCPCGSGKKYKQCHGKVS